VLDFVPLSDPRIREIPVHDSGEPLVDVRTEGPIRVDYGLTRTHALLRSGVVDRLVAAQSLLPRPIRLLVFDGCRADVVPHSTGGSVDLTLSDVDGEELAMDRGATVECARVGKNRRLLDVVLTAVGLVNYPPAWWHWSHGDRYWAFTTGTLIARYGPDQLLEPDLEST
jgi:D-alanyl-D-alanine dipeptidase